MAKARPKKSEILVINNVALVGLRRPGIAIAHPEVVGQSSPNFWRDLSTLLS